MGRIPMTENCAKGLHKWHYNGLVWVCRRGCGAWRKHTDPVNVVRDHNDAAVKKTTS